MVKNAPDNRKPAGEKPCDETFHVHTLFWDPICVLGFAYVGGVGGVGGIVI